MPISEEWLPFDEDTVSSLPSSPGVYEIGEYSRNPIYIGYGNLAEKLKKHFVDMQNNVDCMRMARWFRFEKTESLELAEERERALKKEHWLSFGYDPPCNQSTNPLVD